MISPSYSVKFPPCLCLFFSDRPPAGSIHATQVWVSFNYRPVCSFLQPQPVEEQPWKAGEGGEGRQKCTKRLSRCCKPCKSMKCHFTVETIFSSLQNYCFFFHIWQFLQEKVLDSRPLKHIFRIVSDDLMPSLNDDFDLKYVEPTCMQGATSLTSPEHLSCSGMVVLNWTDSCTWNSINTLYMNTSVIIRKEKRAEIEIELYWWLGVGFTFGSVVAHYGVESTW